MLYQRSLHLSRVEKWGGWGERNKKIKTTFSSLSHLRGWQAQSFLILFFLLRKENNSSLSDVLSVGGSQVLNPTALMGMASGWITLPFGPVSPPTQRWHTDTSFPLPSSSFYCCTACNPFCSLASTVQATAIEMNNNQNQMHSACLSVHFLY